MKTIRTNTITIFYTKEENEQARKKTVKLIKEGFKVTDTYAPTKEHRGYVKLEIKG